MLKQIDAGVLRIGYEESGRNDGWPVILLHGFPYDVRAYDEVAPRLASRGARVIVPYLRGYGPTRFLSPNILRSGEQAALGDDLLALLDALNIRSAILAGYDWGGRAACVVAALWPERVRALVTLNGYNILDAAKSFEPDTPENEMKYWYQFYFHSERGRAGLTQNRRSFCRLFWKMASPQWIFDEATFERTAVSFDNPDFVDVVIQSYRHRFGLAPGDPMLKMIESRLSSRPPIGVPTVILTGAADNMTLAGRSVDYASCFHGRHEHRVIAGAGHNLPQEAPVAFSDAVLTADEWSRS